MHARLLFEWTNDKAKNLVAYLQKGNFLGQGCDDIVNCDDSTYEIRLLIQLKPKRKSRKKKESPDALQLRI